MKFKYYRKKIFDRLLRYGLGRFIRMSLLRFWTDRRKVMVLTNLNHNEILLDGGCGYGINSEEFSSKANWIIGLDIDGNALFEYRKRLKDKASCVKASLEYLPFRRECLSGCILQDALEHTRRPLIVLKQIRTSLKVGGQIIITVPNWYSRFLVLTPSCIEDHHCFHSSVGWKKLLEKTGFEICMISALAFPIINLPLVLKNLHFFGLGVFLKAKKHVKAIVKLSKQSNKLLNS